MITKITQHDLDLHAKWLKNEPGGVQLNTVAYADLRHANLRHANLRYADLRYADLRRADLRRADLSEANLRHADLRYADLSGADLRRADLSGADLRRADLDFAAWSLLYGSKGVKVDKRIAAQLVAHVCVLDCDDPDYQALRKLMLPFAKTSHRARELGLLDEEES